MTDIRFDGDWILLEGAVTKSATSDFMLDTAGRRSTNTPYRRALVHDFTDGLTVNWDRDYPGGVTINDTKTLKGATNGDWIVVQSRVTQHLGTDIMLDGGAERRRTTTIFRPRGTKSSPYRRALVHAWEDQLVVNFNRDYVGGVLIDGSVTVPGSLSVAGQDVATVLASLQAQVTALTGQVTTLTTQVTDLTARVTALETPVGP
ncbi:MULTISPECIES: hypothetical protein [unclassified Phycicoccus]|uniref:hypothetical protein n=1 Tax=unclassified Phycicoccus TaxID=2637926 RepID=UPI0007027AA5|nr:MULTISPECIES: hypothetical protein [unclassified Phycicoccus]KQU65104.1 hypothetical protein ASC58_16390 [Phycicoccus sp. Root101]KQZ89764.1 hypothetical protein ASD62_11080 [Phycicoccus sp. Root563]